MAWVKTNPIHERFTSLCVQNGDIFTVSDDCLEILEEILNKLAIEDCTLRTFRRAIGFGQNIRKHLIPILLHVKDNAKITNASKIIDTAVKILGNLTIPVEYLLPVEAMSRTDVGRHTVFELNRLLTASKEAFTDGRSTKAVVDHMKHIIENDSELDLDQCDSINNCLLLLRNILHIPENRTVNASCPLTNSSMQNQIIWNLFTQSIDKIIIYLMSCPQRMYWGVTMVQLIALMYKDQHVGTLQKLLNLWLEASYSESSEDNESNTSPPDQGSDDSSPVVTSDPTSDSSDTGGNDGNKHNNVSDVVRVVQNKSKTLVTMKRNKSTETETSTSSGISSMGHSLESNDNEPLSLSHTCGQGSTNKKISCMCQSSQSEISDCGYVTQIENQESISTSSNEEDQPHQKPVHQKPHSFQKTRYSNGKFRAATVLEKKELRRKKLVKRSKTNIINMKGLMHHLPTDDDISNILKEFTVDFLLKGYGTLVRDLHTQLLTNIHIPIDTSHFFWLVTYFLKFASQLELDPEHISPVLSYEILSYLVFQGVWVYEELEISRAIPEFDLKPCLRRLHLVVTALREFLQGVETYQKMIHLSDNDKDCLTKLQEQISKMEDLQMLFVLLLKQYNPNIQSKQYLQDIIITNHNFLLFLDSKSKRQQNICNMTEHLKHFACVEIMRQYGLLLENFKENGEFVNNCIFTMMHHIGGDLKNVPTLFQPSILKTFSKIWETDYEICDDWSDLIEYVIHKFINTPGTQCVDSTAAPVTMDNVEDETSSRENDSESEWTKEEKANLLKYYNQSKKSCDTIAKITKKYEKNGLKRKTELAVIRELLDQNIIGSEEYDQLIRNNVRMESEEPIWENENRVESPEEDVSTEGGELFENDIKIIRDYICKENNGKSLFWLQKLLMEVCYVKLMLIRPDDFTDDDHVMEPTVYYFVLLNLPIPIIPWTTEQSKIMKYQPFLLLLHKLGFYLPGDTGKTFAQIPNFWTPDNIFSVAQQLGPVDPGKLKFSINKLNGQNNYSQSEIKSLNATSCYGLGKFSTMDVKQTPIIRYTPLPNTSEWFQTVLRTKVAPLMDSTSKISSTNQLSIAIPDCESITFDIPPPELAIAGRTWTDKDPTATMDYSPVYQQDASSSDEIEKTSNCDTASVASDLTRMCVSDEEEKVILVVQKCDENS